MTTSAVTDIRPAPVSHRHYTWDGATALCGAVLDGRAYGPAAMTVDCPDCLDIQGAREAEFEAA